MRHEAQRSRLNAQRPAFVGINSGHNACGRRHKAQRSRLNAQCTGHNACDRRQAAWRSFALTLILALLLAGGSTHRAQCTTLRAWQLGVVFFSELWGLSQKSQLQQKQQLPQANRPSIVWNKMEDMEESVVPEAKHCFCATIPCSMLKLKNKKAI